MDRETEALLSFFSFLFSKLAGPKLHIGGTRIFCKRYRNKGERYFLSSKDCGGDVANCDGNGVFLDAFLPT
jgi:hypothetical protein